MILNCTDYSSRINVVNPILTFLLRWLIHTLSKYRRTTFATKETRGPWATSFTWNTIPINKHNFKKLWLYHSIDYKRKKKHYLLFENWEYVLKLDHPLLGRLCAHLCCNCNSDYEKIFIFVNLFSIYCYYLPLEKSDIHLNTFESSSPKDALCQVWLKLSQWFLRRRCKCEKFTDRRTTDHRRSEKLTWASAKKLMYMSLIEYTVLNTIIFLLYINSMVCIETSCCKRLKTPIYAKVWVLCWSWNWCLNVDFWTLKALSLIAQTNCLKG